MKKKNVFLRIASLALVVLIGITIFTTAFAQDLKASWLEYQNARHLFIDSYAQIDEAWVLVDAGWQNGPSASRQGVLDSWALIDNAWAEIDAARAIVASTLHITLTDSQPRGLTPRTPSGRYIVNRSSDSLPWTPEPTWGSWDDLNHAWASLNQAWASADSAWYELDQAWIGLDSANGAVAQQWTKTDEEWSKINTAWAEIDAAWAGH